MLQYKAGYKFVDGGVHAQVLDFPAAITCADNRPTPADCWRWRWSMWPRLPWRPARRCRFPTPRHATWKWTLRNRSIFISRSVPSSGSSQRDGNFMKRQKRRSSTFAIAVVVYCEKGRAHSVLAPTPRTKSSRQCPVIARSTTTRQGQFAVSCGNPRTRLRLPRPLPLIPLFPFFPPALVTLSLPVRFLLTSTLAYADNEGDNLGFCIGHGCAGIQRR